MNKKIFKILIMIIFILASVIGIMYLTDLQRMKNGKEVLFSTWGAKYAPYDVNILNENNTKLDLNNSKDYKKFSKTIDSDKIELDIPNDWNYEEIPKSEGNNNYRFTLKFYKNNSEQYAMLTLRDDLFGVCGTGREEEDIILNNRKKACIGYYDGSKNWSDISFYETNKNLVIVNYGLVDDDAKEVIEFIKTINIY